MGNAVTAATPPATEPSTDLAVSSPKRAGLVARMAAKYEVDQEKMLETMRATCFKQRPGKNGAAAVVATNEQMMALLIVAEAYGLNPFTREIYAFPSDLGITPIIGFDGWVRVINERQELQSIEFEYSADGSEDPFIGCTIVRSDRTKPLYIREYLKECYRDTGPWNTHPRRMLRHKALIQCARVAFGFAGVYDPDEEERIAAAINVTPAAGATVKGKPKTTAPRARTDAVDVPAADSVGAAAAKVDRITLDQATVIADAIKTEGIELSRFLAHFELGAIEDLHAGLYAEALETVGRMTAARG